MANAGRPVTQRQLRVGEMIKQSLSMIFLKDEAKIPGINTKEITVTEVRMSPDLKTAKIFVIPLGGKNTEEIIENQSYKHLYMHRTGHWLGLDVHDVGAYRMGDYEVPLKNGMILTVEPGIYISDRIPVPAGQPHIDEKWKGIGIRIEDDVLVKDTNPEILSIAALKEISDLEF